MERYVLRGAEWGYERLQLLARVRRSNIEFRAANVNDWDEPGAYDLVYSRFLLQHLNRPVELLARMWAAVRAGGVIAVEDADFDGLFCHPENDAFAFYRRSLPVSAS